MTPPVFSMSPPSDPVPGSHVHSLRVTPTPRPYTWSHKSTVFMVTPSQTIHLGSHVRVSRESCLTKSFTFSHMSTVPRVTPSRRLCTWGHMSTVYCVTPPLKPSTWGPMFTVSRVTPPPRPCTWSHMSTVFSVTPSRPWTWGHISTVSSVIHLGAAHQCMQRPPVAVCYLLPELGLLPTWAFGKSGAGLPLLAGGPWAVPGALGQVTPAWHLAPSEALLQPPSPWVGPC